MIHLNMTYIEQETYFSKDLQDKTTQSSVKATVSTPVRVAAITSA